MNKTAVEIIETLFKEWQGKSALFATSLKLDSSGLSKNYDIRPFSMQSNETDYHYVTRLMREEGISWLIDEANYMVASPSQSIEPQKLRLIDNNPQYKALDRRSIRFHRNSATEKYDTISRLVAQRTLQPTAIHVQRWQADLLSQEDGSGSVISSHLHSSQRDNASLSLEQAWTISPAWIRDLKGEDQATASSNAQLEKLNKQLHDQQTLEAKYFIAYSNVRDTQVGYWFQIKDHPELDQNHGGSDKEFIILSKHFYNQNNLPKDVQDQLDHLLSLNHWRLNQDSEQERQSNELILVRRNITIVPEYDPAVHRATAHVQRAKVVSDGEEIYVDEWGRIKVRFLFTRPEDHGHDGGAGSNDNDTDSAWVDVLTPWAGEGYGARFLPRKDEMVVIDFFDGNIDRPFVTGRIHEAQRSPTQFDLKGQLPDTKKISGIRSQEVGGGGFNQLRFDDTTGQISSQLQSSHGATQLNLGNLSHPKETAESEGRGEGFELRTDQWGAVRAGDGLLFSTHKQDSAKGTHLDVHEGRSQLEGNFNNAKTLSSIAKNQKTDEIESFEQLKVFFEQIERDIGTFKKAIMLLSAPNSIGLSTSEDIHLSADGQINQYANKSINQSTNNNFILHAQDKISLFAAEAGARLFAGKGKIELQAQNDQLDIVARKGVQIISTESEVIIRANKKIVLESGGSRLEISSAGIRNATGSLFEVKAGQHQFKSGEQKAYPEYKLPVLHEYSQKFLIKDSENQILKNMNYLAVTKSGVYYEGKTDEEGYTKRIYRPESEGMQVYLGKEAEEKLKEVKG